MLLIPCPLCGPRIEEEFGYGGDATRALPGEPATLSDATWTDYLYLRDNPKGMHLEYWFHRHGCGAWLTVQRDTVTHRIVSVRLAAAQTGEQGR